MKAITLVLMTCSAICGTSQLTAALQSPVAVPSTNSQPKIPVGPHVLGVFEGRTPCQELARQLNVPTVLECIKIKWRLILYRDPVTHAPTTYSLSGFVYRNPDQTGKWSIITGHKTNPKAVVYQLQAKDGRGFLSFLKGDDNILFFLDSEGNPMVGSIYFSYTLNRAAP